MSRLRPVIKYLGGLVLFLVIGLLITLIPDKLELHIAMNRLNSPGLDPVFLALNEGAEIAGFCAALLIGVLINFRAFFTVALGLIINGVLTYFFKEFVFPDAKRPHHHFQDQDVLTYVAGVDLHHNLSMPSGHTAAAFTMCVALMLYTPNRRWWIALTVLACAMGYARVYLSQHFISDVFAGAMVGIASALIAYRIVGNKYVV